MISLSFEGTGKALEITGLVFFFYVLNWQFPSILIISEY